MLSTNTSKLLFTMDRISFTKSDFELLIMSEEKHNKQSLLALCLIPLGIIFLGYLFMKEPEQGNSTKTKNSIYTLWIAEAEVAPTKNDASKWDVDGTAPDLSAMIVWKDQVILNTVSSDDSLIGRWDPIAISVGDVIKGEVSTSTVKRIARIRAEKDIKFSIGMFDKDIVSRDYIGGWEIETTKLRPGKCELESDKTLKRLVIYVTQDDDLSVPERSFKIKEATYLDEPNDVMLETVKRWAKEAQEGLKKFGNNVGEEIQKIGEQVDQQKDKLEEAIKETSKKTEEKIRELLESFSEK